ncbi:MAG: tetraacyldisaccharide 4'-kinase [candidate division Zixibacteria bacterium]|nr:tetraacyldisaccharide 4'-kinase [candidate division Zixibacteria bacterium]
MLEEIWKKIIRSEGVSFWRLAAFFLWLMSLAHRFLFFLKKIGSGAPLKLDVPVLSVGNIVVGGSGKTPMVAFIARYLLNEEIRVGIVSSGYGRPERISFVEPGYRVQKMNVNQTGDEVMLLANDLPEAVFAVDESKALAAKKLAGMKEVDVIIVDDGFQHFALARDINLVTYDAGVKDKFLKPFPYGILREPIRAIRRADIVVVTRSKFARDLNLLMKRLQKVHPGGDFYNAKFTATDLVGREQTLSVKYLEDKSVFLFAGVGNFQALRKQVFALSGDLDYAWELSDHQQYDQTVLEEIKTLVEELDSDVIVTTSKDWVKLGNFDFDREIYYLTLSVDLDPGEEKLMEGIMSKLNLKRRET